MQNLSDILPLFCTPTWPSHHVSENQEYEGLVLLGPLVVLGLSFSIQFSAMDRSVAVANFPFIYLES